MISKNSQKIIRSLELKKNRKKENLFVAEGPKVVGDLIRSGFSAQTLYAVKSWIAENDELLDSQGNSKPVGVVEISDEELRRISFLQHPQQVLGVFQIPMHESVPDVDWYKDNLCIALDGVQDPGNLGTIIRIADWFGIDTILCSKDTVDAYSPKVVQATMGSIARVKIHYISLIDKLKELEGTVPVYGTLLDGNNIYKEELTRNGIIIMGNEGKGLTEEVRAIVNHKLFIPSFPPERPTAESLNVAIATAIVCAEFRRQ